MIKINMLSWRENHTGEDYARVRDELNAWLRKYYSSKRFKKIDVSFEDNCVYISDNQDYLDIKIVYEAHRMSININIRSWKFDTFQEQLTRNMNHIRNLIVNLLHNHRWLKPE